MYYDTDSDFIKHKYGHIDYNPHGFNLKSRDQYLNSASLG